jgi:predicted hydrocarbon binding protein
MEIKDKPQPDPVSAMHNVDAYMRWALMAVQEVVGKQGLGVVLRENGLERYIDNFPAEKLEISGEVTAQDYGNLCTGVLKFYGRAGKSMDYRVGRVSTQYAIKKQGALYNVATRGAVRLLPFNQQISTGLDNLINGFIKLWQEFGENPVISREDRGESFAYIVGTCPVCAGKLADEPICHQTTGMLLEVFEWLTGKKV